MKTEYSSTKRLEATLLEKINQWVDENCDADDWSEGWFAPETPDRMAQAAMLIFLSSRDGQRFVEERT